MHSMTSTKGPEGGSPCPPQVHTRLNDTESIQIPIQMMVLLLLAMAVLKKKNVVSYLHISSCYWTQVSEPWPMGLFFVQNPGGDISTPIFSRKEVITIKVEWKVKQKLCRLNDRICRLNDIFIFPFQNSRIEIESKHMSFKRYLYFSNGNSNTNKRPMGHDSLIWVK